MPHLFLFSLQLHFWNFLLEISIWNRGFKTERLTLKNNCKNEDWNVLSFRRPAIQKSRVGREKMIKELNNPFCCLVCFFPPPAFVFGKALSVTKTQCSRTCEICRPLGCGSSILCGCLSFPFGFIDLKTLVWLALLFHSADALNMWRDLKQFFYLFRILCCMWNLMFFYHRVHCKVFWIQRELFLVKPEIDLIGFEAF